MRNRSEQRLLKHANKKDRGNTPRVIIICVLSVLTMAAVLWFVGTVIDTLGDLSQVRPQAPVDRFDDPRHYGYTEEPDIPDPELLPPAPGVVLTGINYIEAGGSFELPLQGATGWASARIHMRATPGAHGQSLRLLTPGQGFTILDVSGHWWYVELPEGETGWVANNGTLINLPDIIPSIIYNITNAAASVKRSYGFNIPGITGVRLYNARAYNPRLGREEYIVPSAYQMAHALFAVQQMALSEGNTLIVYEVFRPAAAQAAVVAGMTTLMEQNHEVNTVMTTPPWHLGWFISTGVSHHQLGAAVDATLAGVHFYEYRQTGDFIYRHIVEHVRHRMPSRMHELSPWAAIFDTPRTVTAAQILNDNVRMSVYVTDATRDMQRYMATAGLNPLASEWWHFSHPASISAVSGLGVNGNFFTETVYSRPPVLNDNESETEE